MSYPDETPVSAETLSRILARQRADNELRDMQLDAAVNGGPHFWACSDGEMAAAIQRCRDGERLEPTAGKSRKVLQIR